MARTLHLLVCISAAMTAWVAGYKYPNGYNNWLTQYNIENSDAVDYMSHDRLIEAPSEAWSEGASSTHQQASDHSPRTFKITNRVLKPAAISRRGAGVAADKVLFPGPTSRVAERKPDKLPEECRKQKLCEEVPGYPVAVANVLIEKLDDKINLAMDELDASDVPVISQRVSGNDENVELCESYTKIIYPEGGLDKNDTYHTILNNKENPIQGIRVEICSNATLPCKKFVCFQSHYEARCVQKFVYRPMLTIDKENNVRKVPLAVPSCCACMANRTIV